MPMKNASQLSYNFIDEYKDFLQNTGTCVIDSFIGMYGKELGITRKYLECLRNGSSWSFLSLQDCRSSPHSSPVRCPASPAQRAAAPPAKRHPRPQLRSPGFCMLREARQPRDSRATVVDPTAVGHAAAGDLQASCAHGHHGRRGCTAIGSARRSGSRC
jgi:hypothetical protein